MSVPLPPRNFWNNPLFARDLAVWQKNRNLIIGILATLLAFPCLGISIMAVLALVFQQLQSDLVGPFMGVGVLFFLPLPFISGILGLAVFFVMPILTAFTAFRLRTSGSWDLLRLTLLDSNQIVDGVFLRAALHSPLWLALFITIPVACISQVAPLIAWWPTASFSPSEIGSSLLFILLGTLGGLASAVLLPILQLLANMALGLAAGTYADTQSSTLGYTMGALAITNWVIPGACGCVFWGIGGASAVVFNPLGTPDMLITLISSIATLPLALYYIALFWGARLWARRQVERSLD